MNISQTAPPPVIDSARLLAFAFTDGEVKFTDRINLYVSDGRLGRVPCLAITRNYSAPEEILLMFCDSCWNSLGVITFTSVEEAKIKAERGYAGIAGKWVDTPYSDAEVESFLRDVYEVDLQAEWWKRFCSFCGKDIDEGQLIVGARATICSKCVFECYSILTTEEDDA